MSTYQYMARRSLQKGDLNYRVRPKHHYTAHLEQWIHSYGWNPQARSTFMDEDHMKALATVAAKLHPRTLRVQFPKRYALKRILSWSEDGKMHQEKKLKTRAE